MTQEFVTLPRDVMEQVRGALAYVGAGNSSTNPNLAQSTCRQAIWKLDHALRAALEQPQNHVPDVGNMVQAGWKLVPVEPTVEMMDAGGAATRRCYQHLNKGEVMCSYVYRHMLDAAPQPQVDPEPVTLLRFNTWSSNEGDSWYDCPTDAQIIEDVFGGETPMVGAEYEVSAGWRCVTATYRITWVSENGDCEAECISHPQENASSASTPRQPQVEQAPVAVVDFTTGGWREIVDAMRTLPDGAQLYTHPQARREPLTHYEIHELFRRSCDDCQDGDEIKAFARSIEAAHGIK